MSALWIKNTSESDPRSYEVTNKAQKKILRLQWDLNHSNQYHGRSWVRIALEPITA